MDSIDLKRSQLDLRPALRRYATEESARASSGCFVRVPEAPVSRAPSDR